ncbi:MAG: hypothetical protein HZB26_08800 [Candidatus Hydrogenedentes bacterium]|nr:hypothetical protein [Candidatus Hydrogenedentota bacterium]
MSRFPACLAIACVVLAAVHQAAVGEDTLPVTQRAAILVVIDEGSSEVERTIADAFARRLHARSAAVATVMAAGEAGRLDLSAAGANGLVVRTGVVGRGGQTDRLIKELGVTASEKPEGYTLDVRRARPETLQKFPMASWEALVAGHDARGMLYGLGKLLCVADYGPGGVTVKPSSLTDAPAITQRGAYFASHFNNFYERAPVDEIESYVDDLAFWGFNHIWTWFDMNWYPEDFDKAPNSRGMQLLDRVRRINQRATGLGLTTGLIGIANEGFKKQPPKELLADMSEKRGGYYPDSTICPSKPGGMDLILKNRRKVLELVGPIGIFIAWPFDQGSCGCSQCKPWAAKFLAICPEIAREVKRADPNAQFYVSTWLFNDEEMKQVRALMDSGADWLGGVVTDTTWPGRFDPPARFARFVFPEISMSGSLFTGYGGSGANPMPHKFVEEARQAAKHGYGAALYSEGIYEDLNKVTWACALWDPKRTAEDIVQEYARFYFGREHLKDWTDLILGLEATWPPENLPATKPGAVDTLYASAERLEKVLPADPASHVRWRYLRDRAEMDCKMLRIGSDAELLGQAKHVLDETGYTQDFDRLRHELRQFRVQVVKRADALKDLFQTHWAYLERAHLERSTGLVITPPAFIGQRDWDALPGMLDRALAETDNEAMRKTLLSGFKEWFWHNNITIDFLFL